MKKGFTLIELSIVLVIIGLIIGGVLVGRDLIAASEVRAQIAQIEKYRTAVHTFRLKYGYLPGDIPDPTASSFGFIARGPLAAEGDGNGDIVGINSNSACPLCLSAGEIAVFWRDLSVAQLIDGNFNTASITTSQNSSNIEAFIPRAKLANSFVYVYAAPITHMWGGGTLSAGIPGNMFGLSAVTFIGAGYPTTNPSISVNQAYAIDSKLDDGLPQLGRVTARYVRYPNGIFWARPTDPGTNTGYTGAEGGSASTCFDNNSTASTNQQYSMRYEGGSNPNCAMSFAF